MKDPKYTIVQAVTLKGLQKQVNELMAKKYIPAGGLVITGTATEPYAQAMVKK